MIDTINRGRAELMKDERELLLSIWDACFSGEKIKVNGIKLKISKVQEIKWPPVNHY